MKYLTLGIAALFPALAPAAAGAADGNPTDPRPAVLATGALTTSAQPDADDWVCREADNICGLRDKRTLSSPAKVDWDTLLGETPEMEEMDRKGIDPNSARGIELRQKAVDRLTTACEEARDAAGHCSVWKSIRHKDGRDIADLTEDVRGRL